MAASFGFHLFAALMVEVSMSKRAPVPPPTPVEISRRVVEGAHVRQDSPIQNELPPSDDPLRNVEAGVPVTLPNAPPSTPNRQIQPPKTSPPVQQHPENKQPAMQPSNTGMPVAPNDGSQARSTNQGSDTGQSQSQPTVASNPVPQVKPGGSAPARRSRGPNRGPFPSHTESPNVPASLAGPGVTNSVDVRVDIRPDGTSAVTLVRSSGSAAVDQIVLDALRRWKWDPAAENSTPVDSSQTFKYVFKIG